MLLLLASALAGPPTELVQDILAVELRRGSPSQLDEFAHHEDPEVRARSALALGRLGNPEGLALLGELLGDERAEVRERAAFALGLVPGGDGLAVETLASEEDPAVRAALFSSLGLHATGLELLVAGLDEEGEIASACALSIGRLALAKVDGVDDPTVVGALLQQLERLRYPDLRRSSAFALGRMAPETLEPAHRELLLHRLAGDHDPTVRSYLVRAGARAAGTEVVMEAVDDWDTGVRVAGARAIGTTGDAALLPQLTILLADPQWSVRMAAIQASGSLDVDHELLLAPFTKGIDGDTIQDLDLAAAAVAVLAVQPGTNLRPWLNPEQPVPIQVAAIGGLTNPDQLTRLATLSVEPAVRTMAANRLTEIEEAGHLHALALTTSTDEMIVAIGLSMLGELGDPDYAMHIAQSMLAHDASDVQLEGLKALDALPGQKYPKKPVAQAIQAAQLHPSLAVRQAASPLAEELGLAPPPPIEPQPIPNYGEVLAIASARIITDAGELRVTLHPEIAPVTVHNFATLAEEDYFDGLAFHRVVPDFVVQDGCPRGDGWGGPGYSIPDELSWLPYDEGVLGMALSGPDTGGSQWFITLSPQPHLNANYTVFGKLDVGQGALRSVHQGTVIQDIVIERRPVETSVRELSADGR